MWLMSIIKCRKYLALAKQPVARRLYGVFNLIWLSVFSNERRMKIMAMAGYLRLSHHQQMLSQWPQPGQLSWPGGAAEEVSMCVANGSVMTRLCNSAQWLNVFCQSVAGCMQLFNERKKMSK